MCVYVYKFEAFLSKEECVQDPDPSELDTQSHIFSITQHHSEKKIGNTKARSNVFCSVFWMHTNCFFVVWSMWSRNVYQISDPYCVKGWNKKVQSLCAAFGRLFAQGECKTTTLSLYAAHGGSKMKPPFFRLRSPSYGNSKQNWIHSHLCNVYWHLI